MFHFLLQMLKKGALGEENAKEKAGASGGESPFQRGLQVCKKKDKKVVIKV
jgi:hypothetical protein